MCMQVTMIEVALEIKLGSDEHSGQDHYEFVEIRNTTNENMNKIEFNKTLVQVPFTILHQIDEGFVLM